MEEGMGQNGTQTCEHEGSGVHYVTLHGFSSPLEANSISKFLIKIDH